MAKPILIIEDDAATRYVYARALEKAGYVVHKARSYLAAIATLAQEEIGLVLLDIQLPGRDGFEIMDAFRAEPALRAIPILVVSGHLTADDRARVHAAGGIDAVEKPIAADALVERIRAILGDPASS